MQTWLLLRLRNCRISVCMLLSCLIVHAAQSNSCCNTVQEYLPSLDGNELLKAVEKNSSGARPKDLFHDILEEVEKQYEADK